MKVYSTGLTRTWVIREPNPRGEGLYEQQGAMAQTALPVENLYVGECGPHAGGVHFRPEEVEDLKTAVDEYLQMQGLLKQSALEQAAMAFVLEPENSEAYEDSKTSNSVAWPPEFLLLCQAVEKSCRHEFSGDVGDGLGCIECHQQPDHWIHREVVQEQVKGILDWAAEGLQAIAARNNPESQSR